MTDQSSSSETQPEAHDERLIDGLLRGIYVIRIPLAMGVLSILVLAPSRAAKTTTSAPASTALIELSPSAPIPVDSAQVEDHVTAPAEDIARDAVLEPVPAKTAVPAPSPPKRNVGHSPSSPRSQPIVPKRRDLPGSGLD